MKLSKTVRSFTVGCSLGVAGQLASAATTSIHYDFSGAQLFVSASGSGSVKVNYKVAGISGSTTLHGTASGTTSWNIDGTLDVALGDDGSFSSTPYFQATRGGGSLTIDFPVLNLGSYVGLNFDMALSSRNSSLALLDETGGVSPGGDWLAYQAYEMQNGMALSFAGAGTSTVGVPLGTSLDLTNQGGQSIAQLGIISAADSSAVLDDYATALNSLIGCHYRDPWFGACLAEITSISWNYSNVSLGTSSLGATDTSPILLPNPVPLPAGFWLMGSGLLGLVGLRFRQRA